MSALQVFQDYYPSLVQSLPMDDVNFTATLYSNQLLPGNLKAKLQLPVLTSAEKATMFLDQMIEPSLNCGNITPFKKLLIAMDYCDLKKLAKTITSHLEYGPSYISVTDGEYT